jgi:hypothetical protein
MAVRPDERIRGARLSCDIDGVTVALQAQDLDPVGLFVATTKALELGREFEVVLRSSQGPLRARVQAVHAVSVERAAREGRRPGFGLAFVGLTGEARIWIGRSLAALARDSAALPSSDAARVAPPAPAPSPAPPLVQSPTVQRRHQWQEQQPRMIARLERELAAIEGKSPWALLGIDPNADRAAVHTAFLKLCKRYHPHAFARFDCPDISRMATQLFIAHKRAYTKLTASLPPAATSKPPPTSLPPQARAMSTPPGRSKGS